MASRFLVFFLFGVVLARPFFPHFSHTDSKTVQRSALCRSRRELSNEIAIPTSIYLQNLASIQPRTSLVKFARCPRTDPPGSCGSHTDPGKFIQVCKLENVQHNPTNNCHLEGSSERNDHEASFWLSAFEWEKVDQASRINCNKGVFLGYENVYRLMQSAFPAGTLRFPARL